VANGGLVTTRRRLFLTLITCVAVVAILLATQYWVKVHYCRNETAVCWGGEPPTEDWQRP
jgi:hypothetical protein